MNINIDFQSRIPIYEQIVKEVERLVALDALSPKEQIPSIRDLACLLSVNPNTVKKAYDILENKNIIISKSTKGTFIVDNIKEAKSIKIDSLFKELDTKIKELEKYGFSKKEIISKLNNK